MKSKVHIKQRDITDCGAACIASVAMYYNLQLPVSRIRQYAGTDKRGKNVLGLIEAAGRLEIHAKGASLEFAALNNLIRLSIYFYYNRYFFYDY
jgi:ATP-binding cassette subfamily B protein